MTSSAGLVPKFPARSRPAQQSPRQSNRTRSGEMQRPVWWLRLAAALPLSALYALASLTGWLTYRMFPYREQVVRENLGIAFPELDEPALRAIMRGYYTGFAQVLMEIVKAASISAEDL